MYGSMKTTLILIALAILVLGAYIRLAPSDPATYHVDPATAPDPGAGGAKRTVAFAGTPEDALAAFDAIVMAAPRTMRLAGSVEEGLITYIARTKWVAFPDYITVKAGESGTGSELTILSRLRFGQSDLGVNARRLDGWLERLETVE